MSDTAETSPATPSVANPAQAVKVPLVWKILGWLLLNLLLLGAALFLLFQAQFRFGLDSILAGPAGARVEAVTQAVSSTLRNSPPKDWDETLESFSKAYGVDFALVGPDARHIAGRPEELPEPVLARIAPARRGAPDGFGPGPPVGKGPSEARGPRREFARTGGPLIQPRFALRTEDPKRYWVGTRIPPLEQNDDGPRRPLPWTLLLVTDSLYAGGLFIDAKLWIIAGLGTLVLSALLWMPLVRGLTKTITQLTRATNEISNGNFSVRVASDRADELGQLGRSVNGMADRLDGFVKGQKRFLGDIAHELCSPIARMEVGLGILEEHARGADRESLSDVREEVREMSGLINELLSFSKASLAGHDAPLEVVSLDELVSDVVRRENSNGHKVDLAVRPEAKALARPDLLRRAVANLIRNALRYASSNGPITISSDENPTGVQVIVRDLGPGVPEQDLQRIFDPFYRTEQSRSRETGGAGLGLAIVKTCIEACGGSVRAMNIEPHGLEVVVTLRRAA